MEKLSLGLPFDMQVLSLKWFLATSGYVHAPLMI